ncbi:porin [Psychrobacter sanguinis]|uniref:porin n=1 Tax=Psychrobacter sanguinis TaxID=861445 RepID=UPI00020C9BC5|nr:porin [Psychrobacter sanguinis]EGK10321.1 porin [Psychrobacter sp. 1501(2011)]MCC3307291.1 porin [Psychrobacter sanguinis]MCD9152583.1 porin [Psychrobacter sanguinis]UEC24644.1 porin [Psychrobacter sanguinis]
MKKLLLASAIAALSVSAANAAPTVYGKIFLTADYVDEEFDSSVAGTNDYNEDGVQINSQGSRIGFKGSEPMTANTDVIYQLEYGIDVDGDDGQSLKNRDTYLGINNKSFGEFRAGKNQSTTDYINNVVVNEGYWDNLGSTKLDSEQKVAALNMADSGRIANSIVWKAPKFEGVPVEFAAMYANDDDITGENQSGWGVSAMFDQGAGYTLGLAYEDDLNIKGSMIRGTGTLDLATFNSGFPVTLGALYQEADYDRDNSKKEKGYVVSAQMGLTNFAKPATIYAQYNNTSDLDGVNGWDSDQIVVGGKYYYQKNMIAHAYVGQNDADFGNNGDGKVFAVGGGLEYKF